MNTQKLTTFKLTDAQLASVDAALSTLETELAALIALAPTVKRRIRKMGSKGESFSRQALQTIRQNPEMIPPNMPVAEALQDLKELDQLRPRLTRLSRLCQRGDDTHIALGADVMRVALQAFGQLKLTGVGEGMIQMRRELSSKLTSSRRAKGSPTAEAAKAA